MPAAILSRVPMQSIDWCLVIAPLAVVMAFALYTRRYVRSVADFLAAGRCAGRYLLANARGGAESGLASSLAVFETIFVAGFVLSFWEKIQNPIVLLITISGFVTYRLRETRAMTMAQFFEMRYSRPFRLFMGMLAFVSGILNYGIFPAVSARFFIYFLDLPLTVVGISTFALIMAAYLSITVMMVLAGGQVTLMVVDCIEGLLSHLIYIILAGVLFVIVGWHRIIDVLAAAPPGHSPMNPFDAEKVKDFNFWFILMGLFIRIYITGAFQGRQGFTAAARTPHEGRMGGVLGEWRGYARQLMLLLLGVCALTFLSHPSFADRAATVHSSLSSIADETVRKQMTVPVALKYLLPVGAKGLFCVIMIMGLLASDSAHQHSWGSILVQDIVLPLRNERPLSPRQHLWMLRLAVTGVAIWALCFSLFFKQTQYIVLWWQITGGVFTAGAGAAIIGGLYWKKGTTAAAWTAALTGSVLSLTAIGVRTKWPHALPFNDMVASFLASLIAAGVYVLISLLSARRGDYNLDALLHRGKYAVEEGGGRPLSLRERFTFQNIFRFDENFTRTDKLVAGGVFWWSMVLLLINAIVTIWNLAFGRWPIRWWADYWLVIGIVLPFVIALLTLVWFSIGGVRDMRDFFAALKTRTRDASDDGRVPERTTVVGFEPIVKPSSAAVETHAR